MSLAQDSGESDVDFEHGRNATASLPDRRAEAAVADLLLALGRDLGDADLVATPSAWSPRSARCSTANRSR